MILLFDESAQKTGICRHGPGHSFIMGGYPGILRITLRPSLPLKSPGPGPSLNGSSADQENFMKLDFNINGF